MDSEQHDFTEIEAQLGIKLHQSIKDYFNAYWFGSIQGEVRAINSNQKYIVELYPVLPGDEMVGVTWYSGLLMGEKQYFNRCKIPYEYIYIGEGEEDTGNCVYVHNETGKVFLIDRESDYSTGILIGNSLEELIYNLE